VNFRLIFIFVILLGLSFESFGFFVRGIGDEENADVLLSNTTLGSGLRTPLIVEGKSSDSVSNAVKVYIPFASFDNKEFSYHRSATNGDFLPVLDNSGNVTNGAALWFSLNIEVDGAEDRLVAAIKNDDGKYVIVSTLVASASTDSDLLVSINLDDICDDSDELNCSDYNSLNVSSTGTDSQIMAIFLTDNDSLIDGIDESSITNASFYEITVSNRIFPSEIIRLNSVGRGEQQLFLSYSGFSTMTNLESIYGIALETSGLGCDVDNTLGQTLGDLNSTAGIGLSNIISLETIEINDSSQKIKDLANDQCYQVRVTQCDKFGFCSEVSNQIDGTPELIAALLTKNGCFFFTAGFEGDHYIIDYFRSFRDDVLRKSFLGNTFVNFYYRVGPKYAPLIIGRPWIQKSVRALAYVLYGLLNYLNYIFYMIAGIACVFIMKKLRGVISYGRS